MDRKMQRLQDCYDRLRVVDAKAQQASFDLFAHIITPEQFRDIVEPINHEREITLNEIMDLEKDGYCSGPVVMGDGDNQRTVGRVFYKNKDI